MKKYNFVRTGILVAMLCLGIRLQAQTQIVSGVVRDAASGLPLIGAQIKTADQSAAAITDTIGAYSVKIQSLSGVLIVTAPGYAFREVPLQGRTRVDINLFSLFLTSGHGEIESVSGSRRKSMNSQASNEVSGFQPATAMSVDSKLQDLLGGDVRAIHRSGLDGIGASLFIRGFNSLNATAQPLIIVDGVVWDNQVQGVSIHKGYFSNPLANINVTDIESITVLKDGNSIYGSKAANGVILINTARAKDMATRITANLSWGMNTKPHLPKMMNDSQYRTYASDLVKGWYQAIQIDNPSEETILLRFPFLNGNQPEYGNNTRWGDEVYQNGLLQDYSIGISGGDEVAMFNLSMGYTTNEGTVRNTDIERFNVRFNSDITMSSRLTTRIDLAVGRTFRNLRDDGVNDITAPGFVALAKSPLLSPCLHDIITGNLSRTLSDYDALDPRSPMSNPLTLTDVATGSSSRVNFSAKLNPQFRLSKNLLAGTVFSYNLNRVKESFFIPQKGVAPTTISVGDFFTIDNEVRDLAQRQNSILSNTYIKWNTSLNTEHHFDLMGGYRFMFDDYEWKLPSGFNTGNDNIKVLTDGLGFRSIVGDNRQWKSMSWYAAADYDYQQKYILSLTASADASSRFGQATLGGFGLGGVRWALFPSVSGAWLISSEEFMKNVPEINFLKLRASYGLTGNDGIDVRANRLYFESVYFMGGATGLELASIQNQAIEWETSYKAGAGLDIHLFDDRLLFSADVFSSRTENLLTQKSLKSITGMSYYWSNGGALKNQGFELNMNGKVVNTKAFKWELGGSVGHYKNEITALPDGDYITEILGGNILTGVGHPAGVFYGYKTQGVFATTEEATASGLYKLNDNGTLTPYGAGDVRFVDPNGNGIITTKNDGSILTPDGVQNLKDSRQIIGDPNPDFYGTITSRFKLKRLMMDALFTYSCGNDVYNYLRSQLESGATFYNQTTAITNRWTVEGQQTNIPRSVYGDPMQNNTFSDRWIEDGSYLRLKTLTLSYDIPVNSIYLQGITLWTSVNNLFTWTKYLGGDPEFSMNSGVLYQGIDAGLIPQSRSYFIGVKINL